MKQNITITDETREIVQRYMERKNQLRLKRFEKKLSEANTKATTKKK